MNEYLKSKNESILNTSNPWWNVNDLMNNDLMNNETFDNASIESSDVETEAAQINAD